MRKILFALCFVSTSTFAIDFDTEWKAMKIVFAKVTPAPAAVVTVVPDAPVVTAVESTDIKRMDPRSPHLLGYTLSDPVMRNHVTQLYKRPDVIVLSTTIY